MAEFTLKNVNYCMWIAVVLLVLILNIDAIRVYEGANFPAPVSKIQKSTGLTKKSSSISKRSWSPMDDGLKSNQKADRRLEGKWKDYNKRTMTEGTPSLYKIRFTDKNYMQYLRYIREMPRLEEYTFCMWYKPTNLTHDQTLFTYTLNKNEILLRVWINALDSTLRLAVRENVVYKVPAVIREYKWHHICQSWNGVFAEVQIFLDGKRVGESVLSHYKGTYIPEGGEVTLGQDISGLGSRYGDAIDGELFGFNMVDESVPQDQADFINSQYRPSVQSSIPPFKKLPPIKKTYQEIKAYIATLPTDPLDSRKKAEAPQVEEPNTIKKPKDSYSIAAKRNRGNHRIRYPPLRKVVIYNREDRQLPIDDAAVELNKTNPVKGVENIKNHTANQLYDENYSIHSYRFEKQEKKNSNYEIYETLEDDVLQPAEEKTDEKSLEKKARQNFNLFTAREANKVYTLSNSVKDLKKPKFHFETNVDDIEQPETSGRSFDVEESKTEEVVASMNQTDSIPVYEIAVVESRKRRSADGERNSRQFARDDPLVDSNGFRRLPQIPDSFINLFTQNASKSEIEEKLDKFFPESEPRETNVVAEITESPKTYIPVEGTTTPEIETPAKMLRELPEEATALKRVTEPPPAVVPEFSPMPPSISNAANAAPIQLTSEVLTNPKPINFPLILELEEIQRPQEEPDFEDRYYTVEDKEESMVDRKFDISAGTDLLMRSYVECTNDRGSPVREKRHLVISWADTPVRIFGGAQVENARNECGNF